MITKNVSLMLFAVLFLSGCVNNYDSCPPQAGAEAFTLPEVEKIQMYGSFQVVRQDSEGNEWAVLENMNAVVSYGANFWTVVGGINGSTYTNVAAGGIDVTFEHGLANVELTGAESKLGTLLTCGEIGSAPQLQLENGLLVRASEYEMVPGAPAGQNSSGYGGSMPITIYAKFVIAD